MYFNDILHDFFCNQNIEDYFLKGKRGLIEFNLETSYIKKNNLYLYLKYSFDIFTAYSSSYLERLGLPKNTIEDDMNPLPMAKEYIKTHNLDESFIKKTYLKNHKDYQNILKIPEEKVNENYFLRKKNEKKEVIDVYVDLKFRKHDVSIDTGILEEGEDFSVLEQLGYNSKMPPDKELKEELGKFNLTKIYNITLPFSTAKWWNRYQIGLNPLNFFTGIKNLLEANAQEILFPHPKYFKILTAISEQGLKYNLNKTCSLNELNRIREKISIYEANPLVSLVKELFYSLTKTLIMNRKILECKHCSNLIQYKKGKKYCSYKSEGKDCGKPARNKRAYLKRKKRYLK
ncbi:hypothetical protein ES703_108854 [subsurface metagenome]